jgi:hypothetical protein
MGRARTRGLIGFGLATAAMPSLSSDPVWNQPFEGVRGTACLGSCLGVVDRVDGRRGLPIGESVTSSGARRARLIRCDSRGVKLRMPREEVRGVSSPVRGLICWPRRLIFRGEDVRGDATLDSGGFASRKALMPSRYFGGFPKPARSCQSSISGFLAVWRGSGSKSLLSTLAGTPSLVRIMPPYLGEWRSGDISTAFEMNPVRVDM